MYHKVQDFRKWKAAFEAFNEVRQAAGEIDFSVGTLQNEPNTAYVLNTWGSIEQFEAFAGSEDLKEGMAAAGVLEPPHIIILSELDKG
jgi:quinol monooxygenase YgiN